MRRCGSIGGGRRSLSQWVHLAMGMVVTRLSLVLDGGMSAVKRPLGGVTGKRAVGVIPPA